jgi:hypothetical protein
MDELRRTFRSLAIALAAPLIVLVMVLLAVLTGLAYYLAALIHGFWSLFRDLPRNLKTRQPLQKPHFLKTPAPGRPVD